MSQSKLVGSITKPVDATLGAAVLATPASYRYTIVAQDASGDLTTPANAGTRPIGVLQNLPKFTGAAGKVGTYGTTKVLMMETCDENEGIVADPAGTGKGSVADADNEYVVGISLEAATAAGDIIEVLLTPGAVAVGDES